MLEIDPSIIKYICFNCATIKRQFVRNNKFLKKFYNSLVNDNKCLKCESVKFDFKDAFSQSIQVENFIDIKTKKK